MSGLDVGEAPRENFVASLSQAYLEGHLHMICQKEHDGRNQTQYGAALACQFILGYAVAV